MDAYTVLDGRFGRVINFLQRKAGEEGSGDFDIPVFESLARAKFGGTARALNRNLKGVSIRQLVSGKARVTFSPGSVFHPKFSLPSGTPSPAPRPEPKPEPEPKTCACCGLDPRKPMPKPAEPSADFETIEVGGTKFTVPGEFRRMSFLVGLRQNILLVGPAGCGKTFLAELVAKKAGMKFSSISLAGGVTESALLGKLLPTGENGKFEYAVSEYVHMFEHGGVFLLDEVDAADPNVLLVLNQSLANDRLPVPSRLGNATAKRHPEFVCIAAANTWGHGADRAYVGRNQLDAAFLDRFRASQIALDYNGAVEKALIDPVVLDWGRRVREKAKELGLRRVLSTRVLLQVTHQVKAGGSFTEAKGSYFSDWKKEEIEQCDPVFAKVGK